MAPSSPSTSEQVARIVRQCLEHGGSVEIDGLGEFRSDSSGGFQFLPHTQLKIFLAYVAEDLEAAEKLYACFRAQGFDAWLDRKKLLPGQNWPRSIEQAISVSDFFVACFSQRAIGKRGGFQSELRYALDCASRLPLEEVFLIPVRLEECRIPVRISREFHYVDLFPNWESGVERIQAAIRKEAKARRTRSRLAR
jgi:hypothetical protein